MQDTNRTGTSVREAPVRGPQASATDRFFVTAWRGGYPLWLTYWVIGVGGNMSFVAVIAALWLATAAPQPPVWALSAMWVLWGVSVVWHGFVTGAIWRAGRHYPGPRIWPWLARFGCLLGLPRLTLEALILAGLLR